MKTLLLLRHGKAEDSSPLGDIGRELTNRGRKDFASIGKQLKQAKVSPEIIIASTAARAQMTAEIVAEALGSKKLLTTEPKIYEAEAEYLLALVHGLPNTADTALLVGHNPGFWELTMDLIARGTTTPTMGTANLAHLEFDVDQWETIMPGTGELADFYKPD